MIIQSKIYGRDPITIVDLPNEFADLVQRMAQSFNLYDQYISLLEKLKDNLLEQRKIKEFVIELMD